MVARHEMPGSVANENPSRRVRYDRLVRALNSLGHWRKPSATNHAVPYGTDHVCPFPRHFMPGYHHLVPPGQRLRFLMLMHIGSGGVVPS
jgi:hypothetical protein